MKENRIKLKGKKYKKLISNFSYLTSITIINKLLPLLITPFIVRIVGVEKFGIIIFALSISSYLILITQYSFTLTATKYISLHRDNNLKLSQHFWLVLIIRLILFCTIALLFTTIIVFINISIEHKAVFLFTALLVFADVLLPLWFFRGIEEMQYIAIFNIIAKILYALSVWLLIQQEKDYLWIPMLNSSTLLLINGYSLYFAIKKYHIQFILPSAKEIKDEFIKGKDVFLSNISVSFYTTINTLLLGFLTNYAVVGVYALAETIFMAFNSIIKSYTMVIYPHLAKYLKEKEEFLLQAKKFFSLYLIILLFSSLFLFLISPYIVTLLFGEGHFQSIRLLQIFAIALILEPLGGFFTAYLSLNSKYSTIRSITFKTMIVNLILVVPMIYLFEAEGAVYLFLLLSIVQVYLNIKENREIFHKKVYL